MLRASLLTTVFMIFLMGPAQAKPPSSPENILILDLPKGRVTIRMMPDLAPHHVAQVKTLTRQGFYDNLAWFRVIDGFMAQTGYPLGSHGKSDLPDLPAEFSSYKFHRGTVGMGHSADPNSANSQFFICLSDAGCKDLTGKYTAWGQVTDGMAAVDALKRGEPPQDPDTTRQAAVAADLPH